MGAVRKPRGDDDDDVPTPKKGAAKKTTKAAPVLTDASAYLDAMRKLVKKNEDADEVFSFFSSEGMSSDITEFIPTGSLATDRLIGGRHGGWPVGRISECAAWEGVGKSTLLDQSIAEVQKMGGIGVLVDSERARDQRYSARMGVDVDKLIASRADTVEEVWDVIGRAVDVQEKVAGETRKRKQEPPPMLIVWDSLGGTPTDAEMAADTDDKLIADAAKRNRFNLRRLNARIDQLRIAIVICNHFYQGIGPFASLSTYGGAGIRYFTSLRLWLTRKNGVKIGDRTVGHVVQAKLKKTRIRNPTAPVETALIYGAGFDNAFTLFEWGKKAGAPGADKHRWIVQNGAWSYLMLPEGGYDAFNHTFVGFAELLKSKPDIYARLADQYLSEDVGEGADDEGE